MNDLPVDDKRMLQALDLLGAASIDDFLSGMARFVVSWIPVSACGVWWLDKSQDKYEFRLCHGDAAVVAIARHWSILGEWTRRTGFGSKEADGVDASATGVAPQLSDALLAPIRFDDQVVGIIAAFPSAVAGSSASDLNRNLESVALHAGAACKNLDHLARSTRLGEILDEMNNVTYEAPLLDIVLEQGKALLGCEKAAIRKVNLKTGQLDYTLASPKVRNAPALGMEEGLTGQALKAARAVRADDVTAPKWRDHYRELWPGSRSNLAVPIILPRVRVRLGKKPAQVDKAFGVLDFESKAVGAFSAFDERSAETIARHMGRVLERLEIEDKSEKLRRAEREISRERDWEAIVERLFQAVTETLGAEYLNFSLVDPDTATIKSVRTFGVQDHAGYRREAMHKLASDHIQASIVTSRAIEVLYPDDPRLNKNLRERFGLQKFICVFIPILAPSRDEVLGTICAGYDGTYRKYVYELDVQLLKSFVDFTAGALEFSRRGVLDRVSHEINAPLSAVRNNLSVLQRRWKNLPEEKIVRALEDMETDSEILHYQVQRLEYALGDRGSGKYKQPLQTEELFLFRDIIFKTINQLRGMVKDRGLDPLKVSYEPESVFKVKKIKVDKSKISQVIFNLFVNAVKYSASPETFKILIGAEERTDSYVIRFSDCGIGVPESLKEKIFEDGFRAPAALERNVTGSGLGLTISRRIMREHGGDLILHHCSNPTEFHMIIPKRSPEN